MSEAPGSKAREPFAGRKAPPGDAAHMAEMSRRRIARAKARRAALERAKADGLDLDGVVALAVDDPLVGELRVHQALEVLYGFGRARQDDVLEQTSIDLRKTLKWLASRQGHYALQRLRAALNPPPPHQRPERPARWPWHAPRT